MKRTFITDNQIETQRRLYSQPILIGNHIAIKILNSRNRHFGIIDNCKIDDKITICIDPGYAFGDGTHPTTKMCVENIEKYITSGDTILDIGCGCGILSIAALCLGAEKADGVDISAEAVKVSLNNAKLNNVENKFSPIVGNLTDNIVGCYDIVVANLLSDPLIQLLETLQRFIHNRSTVIISGIHENREQDVRQAIDKNFIVVEQHSRDGWICYVLKPNSVESE